MSPPTDHLDRFCRAVHRRWIVVRAGETAGVGVAVGCGVALLVLPILLWRGEPAMPVLVAAGGVAGLAGLIAGVIRRPDVLAAAAEADRQLDLADLLSTALTTRERCPGDPWAAVVLATAEARCRTLSASAVVVNRLGGRAWGGIGLTTALALTLALMSANPPTSSAVAVSRLEVSDAAGGARRSSPLAQSRPERAASVREARDQFGQAGSERAGETGRAAANGDHASRSSSATNGGGPGFATSPRESNPSAVPGATASRPPPTGGGIHASGGSAGAGGTGSDDATAGSTAASARHAQVTPPWRSDRWGAARDEALSAVRDGRVPDTYRDLVREYFENRVD